MNILNIFKPKKLKLYKSCKTLWLYNFHQILDSDDYRWLVIGFNENSELTLNEKQQIELKELWQEIFERYIILKGDQSVINNLRKKAKILEIKKQLYWGSTLLQLIIRNPTSPNLNHIIDELKRYKFRIDKEKPLVSECDSLTSQLKSLKTKYNMEVSRYEKVLSRVQSKENTNVDQQVINVAKTLDLKYPIDQKSTVVTEWLAYCERAKQVIANNLKHGGNS